MQLSSSGSTIKVPPKFRTTARPKICSVKRTKDAVERVLHGAVMDSCKGGR